MPRLLIGKLLRLVALLVVVSVFFLIATLAVFAESPVPAAPETAEGWRKPG